MSEGLLIKHHNEAVTTPTKELDHYFSTTSNSNTTLIQPHPTNKSTKECLAKRESENFEFPSQLYINNPLSEEEIGVYQEQMVEYLRQGDEYFVNKSIDQALQCYRQAIMLNNQVSKFLHKDREKFLKSCNTKTKRSDGVLDLNNYLFDDNYEVYPLRNYFKLLDILCSKFWNCIARCYMAQEKFEDCIDACTTALDLNPDYSKVRLRRAQAHLEVANMKATLSDRYICASQHLEEAVQDYKYLLRNDPNINKEPIQTIINQTQERLKRALEIEQQEGFRDYKYKAKTKPIKNVYIHHHGINSDDS